MSDGIPCMWMRGGTSKGGYFLASDLPIEVSKRDDLLLKIMGSPDPRQIDGMGGADPLTSKVAVVQKSSRPGIDVDYLFLQVSVDRALVTTAQNCGNILAGIGAFAIERGLVPISGEVTSVFIFMENSEKTAIATIQTPEGTVCYQGSAGIDGVPGTAAPVSLEFQDIAGSICGALLPTGHEFDVVDGIKVTMIDNGMPCVILRARDVGVTGYESHIDLDADDALKARLERIRLLCGPLMNLGNVQDETIPKMTLISPAASGGALSTRTFTPHRCHASIGVFGAVSIASACLIEGTCASEVANIPAGKEKTLSIEHLGGEIAILARMKDHEILGVSLLRTANKLMEGVVFP